MAGDVGKDESVSVLRQLEAATEQRTSNEMHVHARTG